MTNQELFIKNNILQTEFSRYLLEHPRMAQDIPNNAEVVILPENDPELAKANQRLVKAQHEHDRPIVFIHVKNVKPQRSRLVRPRLLQAA